MRRLSRSLAAGALLAALLGGTVAGMAAAADAPGTAPGAATDGTGLSGLQAVALGIIEGVTEFLPVSSTGHLTVAQRLMGIGDDAGSRDAADSYAIAIQAGAILAVLGLYRHRFAAMAQGLAGNDADGRRTLVAVAVAFVPAAVLGLILGDVIKERLFGPWPVVAAWFAGGVAILAVSRRRDRQAARRGAPLEALGWRGALTIGLAQSLALWPGVSRSLVTILAATVVGLSVPAAVEFSFLLGFFTLGAATAYESLTGGQEMVRVFGWLTPVVGLATAFVSAALAMRWMVGYLNHHSLAVFGYYRIAIAAVVGLLLLAGVL